jgi:predicted  nucleic acid-binding Zn-ribbon protein
MTNATKAEQQDLLELFQLDVLISRSQKDLADLESNEEIVSLRAKLLDASEGLLNASSNLEHLNTEASKIASDEKLVSDRLVLDDAKSKTVSTDRELKAIQSEIESLRARKENLEDLELELLEQIESATLVVSEFAELRKKLGQDLESETASLERKSLTIKAHKNELQSKRELSARSLPSELLAAYTRKSQRGLAVSQTLGRDCSACRLSINSVEFDAIMAKPEDVLPNCPNCDAFIVR